jgi:polygalacturonase
MAKKLREAGAIILGKTNLSQWANYRSSNSSNGWSAYGGQVYAAYYPRQDPSGSSSGSGVASSLGLALGSLGTEVGVLVSIRKMKSSQRLDRWLYRLSLRKEQFSWHKAQRGTNITFTRYSNQ